MATSAVQTAIQSWKQFNLADLRTELDSAATDLAEQQDHNDISRKKLIELSRDFKKNTPEDVRKSVAPIMKTFQHEIDSLHKRSKFAEIAFLSVYKKILDVCDPLPALEHCLSLQHKASKVSDLEIETKQLRATLKEYNEEFKEVKNQDVTIKQLREKIKDFEESVEKRVLEKTKAAEKELSLEFTSKEKHLEEEILELKKKLYDAEQRTSSLQGNLNQIQSELFDLKSCEEENNSARSDEMEILLNDIEKANHRASMAEKELCEIKSLNVESKKSEDEERSSNVQSYDMIKQSSIEVDLAAKEREISQLVADYQNLQGEYHQSKEFNEKHIDKLQSTIHSQNEKITNLEEQVHDRMDYFELKEELGILKTVEFANVAQTVEGKPLEVLLLEKNKSLNSENTNLRLTKEEAFTKIEELNRDYMEAVNTVQEQQSLISQLENDVSNVRMLSSYYRGEGEGEAAPLLSTELVAEAVKEVVPSPVQDKDDAAAASLLPIVSSQRERFRQRNEELESVNSLQQQQINVLQGEVDQLRGDNIKLYEKIKFLQSFSVQRSSHSDDMENRYSSQYEAKLDPFSSFSKKERQRKYMNLSPFEKITLGMGRVILANKIARTFAFVYTLLLHCLIFLVLYKLAHTESCKRDFSSEWHSRFAEHMQQVHGQALDHTFAGHGG